MQGAGYVLISQYPSSYASPPTQIEKAVPRPAKTRVEKEKKQNTTVPANRKYALNRMTMWKVDWTGLVLWIPPRACIPPAPMWGRVKSSNESFVGRSRSFIGGCVRACNRERECVSFRKSDCCADPLGGEGGICYLLPRTRYSEPGSQISGWKSSERKWAGLAPLLLHGGLVSHFSR